MESEDFTSGCFGKDFNRISADLGSRSDVSVESLDIADEKRSCKSRKEKGYAHLQRPSSEEELVFVRSKPKKTKVFGKLKEKAREREKEVKSVRLKSKSKSRGHETTPPVHSSVSSIACPLFGVSLSECLRNNPSYDNVPVPAVVRQCIDYVNDKGLSVEGIYRVTPEKNIVESLRESVGSMDGEVEFQDVHCATCVLKMFIRELPETLFTAALIGTFEMTVKEIKNIAECLGRLNELIERLPDPNKHVLAYFFLHIQRVIKMQDVNKMTAVEMSTALQPVFNISPTLLNIFLQNAHLIFPNILPKKYVILLLKSSIRTCT
ncbi:unnamed protein product [Soboliphyme baturini]|uniref:Rho-GAP domain-containing protein n=1 Tax=Soboliphyme baturini TaxID=241478 RepID=A0A183IDB1_9BILA|nr:unnamed protein product [Soboliphyme baturini]